MKIATKRGDNLQTGLLFGGERHNKSERVFKVLGDLDELSSFIGLLKNKIKNLENSQEEKLSKYPRDLEKIQLDMIKLMGEINCLNHLEVQSYISKYDALKESDYCLIDEEVSHLQDLPELKQISWVLYGKTEIGSLADICSKVTRRAERNLAVFEKQLNDYNFGLRPLIKKYINRLSDYFYLVARLSDFLLYK